MNPLQYTTNAEDQAEVAKLNARLQETTIQKNSSGNDFSPVTPVKIANGVHKYVLISAKVPSGSVGSTEDEHYFVTSKRGAKYHRNAAEPFVHDLEQHGYVQIKVMGGGRIDLDETAQKIAIYGFSYGFGLANHEISKRVVSEDARYADFDITTSNEGY